MLKLLPKFLDQNDFAHSGLSSLCDSISDADEACSGKFLALGSLLEALHRIKQEKVVVVSNFTSTLDIIEAHCASLRYNFCRLDGSVVRRLIERAKLTD